MLLVIIPLYTIVFMVGLSILIFVNERSFVRPSDCIKERLKRNIHSGTVVGCRVLDSGVWVAEIVDCSLIDPQIVKHSYLQTCEFLERKTLEASAHSSVI